MEIKSLLIENFQSHKSTKIKPAPGGQLTVITGPSDSGKTAILRALRWLYFNTPQGTDFIRVGAREATVVLALADGTNVIRNRSRGGKNSYNIDFLNGEKQTFTGFGVNVPLEVQQLTGVMPVQIGDLELNLNLAEQLDGPFLGKSISAGARAKVLGKLAGTEEVDYAGKQLAADLHRRGQDEKRLAAEIAGLEEKIREFGYLPAMKARIEAIEGLVGKAKAAAELRDKLAAYLGGLRQCEAGISQARAIIFSWRRLKETENLLAGIEKDAAKVDTLRRLAQGLAAAENGMTANQDVLRKWAGLEEAENILAGATEEMARAEILRHLARRLMTAENGINNGQGILHRWSGLEKGAAATLYAAELFERYTRLGGLGQKIVRTARDIVRATLVLDGLQHLETAAVYVEAAGTKLSQYKILLPLAAKLNRVNAGIETARQETVLHENRVADLEGAYSDALVSAGRCPLCGSKVKIQGGQIGNLKEVV